MAKFVRVDIPVGLPKETLELCKEIVDKHTALGAGSPLTGFVDMADFDAKRIDALNKQKLGNSNQKDSVSFHGQAMKKCGISSGQNKTNEGTVYWFVLQIRDVLLIKFKGQEQDLELWGFPVVISQTGARRNVRVEIPYDNPETLTELAEAIIEKHTALGVGSPLNSATELDLADFGTKVAAARTLVDDFNTADADAQAFHGQALTVLGYADGQNSENEDTLYYGITQVRDRLLQVNQGEEQNLEQWGFNVVIHEAATGSGSGSGSGVLRQGGVPVGGNIVIDTVGLLIAAGTILLLTNPGNSALRYFFVANAGSIPGPADPFADVPPAGISQVTAAQIGFIPGTKTVFSVQNIGAVPGEYKVQIGV